VDNLRSVVIKGVEISLEKGFREIASVHYGEQRFHAEWSGWGTGQELWLNLTLPADLNSIEIVARNISEALKAMCIPHRIEQYEPTELLPESERQRRISEAARELSENGWELKVDRNAGTASLTRLPNAGPPKLNPPYAGPPMPQINGRLQEAITGQIIRSRLVLECRET
jgi:hypothetical protein